jgi:hypothetical protein
MTGMERINAMLTQHSLAFPVSRSLVRRLMVALRAE